MILVTGGTGLVGSHLLYKLTKAKQNVRAIYRQAHKLDAVKRVFAYYTKDWESQYDVIDWVEADITNLPQLQIAFDGVTQVYHCAAYVSFDPNTYRTLRKTNIEGTANIVNLSISHQIKTLCYVSSIAAIGHHNDPKKLITEDRPWNPEEDNNVYAITKYGAELEVWRGAQEGLDVIVLNPGIILGPGFWHGGGSSGLFKRIYNGLDYYTKGGTGYVDVYDVVDCMLQLMKSNIRNESFILVAENLSFKNFSAKVADALSVSPAKKHIKFWQLQCVWRLDWLTHKLFGKRRKLSKQLAHTLVQTANYDNSKLKTAIDFNFKPIDTSITDVSSYFLEDLKSVS